MNIEIANRLVNLRKGNNLSQEALAEKLGISRQAVSKWERAEASPDTDNLILLSRLYGISLDELLKTDEEIPGPLEDAEKDRAGEIVPAAPPGQEAPGTGSGRRKDEYVHVGFEGVHVKDAGERSMWDGTASTWTIKEAVTTFILTETASMSTVRDMTKGYS